MEINSIAHKILIGVYVIVIILILVSWVPFLLRKFDNAGRQECMDIITRGETIPSRCHEIYNLDVRVNYNHDDALPATSIDVVNGEYYTWLVVPIITTLVGCGILLGSTAYYISHRKKKQD